MENSVAFRDKIIEECKNKMQESLRELEKKIRIEKPLDDRVAILEEDLNL